MTEPLTPEKVEKAIVFYMGQLGSLITEYAEASDEKAKAHAAYDLSSAHARNEHRAKLAADGEKITEGIVNDHATVTTYEALVRKMTSAAREETIKLSLRAAQAKLDGARSLGSNMRGVG